MGGNERRAIPFEELSPEERERAERILAEQQANLPEPVVVTVKVYGTEPGQCEFGITLPGSPGSLRARPAMLAAIRELQDTARYFPDSDAGERVEPLPPDVQRLVDKLRSGERQAVADVERQLARRGERLSKAERRLLEHARRMLAERRAES